MNAYAQFQPGLPLAGEPADRPTAQAAAREAELFQIALRAESSLELDWLWLYMQVTSLAQRRYCLEQALAINPSSAIARRELALLEHMA